MSANISQSDSKLVATVTALNVLRPNGRDLVRLRCRSCPGAEPFTTSDLRASCPTCGGDTGPAATTRPAPVAEVTASPFDADPIVVKLQARQKALPAEIRQLETRLVDLRATRKAANQKLAETRVLVSAGVAREKDVDRAEAALASVDADIVATEDALDAITSTVRVVAEQIVAQTDRRRADLAKTANDRATKFVDAVAPLLTQLERLFAEAEADGAAFDRALKGDLYPSERAGRAVAILRWGNRVPRKRTAIVDLIASFRRLTGR